MKQLLLAMALLPATLVGHSANDERAPFAEQSHYTSGITITGWEINSHLSGNTISRAATDIPADGLVIEVSGEGILKTLIEGKLQDGETFSDIKTLIIKEHEITQGEFDFLATDLKDMTTLNLADATLPDDVRLGNGTPIPDKSVHWQFLVLPKGTKIRPNFEKYSSLKYAVGGALEKIWIVSTGAGYITNNIDEIKQNLPAGINTPAEGIRLSVAFVGEINADDVKSLVGSSTAPLNAARIWHFYNSTGLQIDDFQTLGALIQGDNNNSNPTGFVLPAGMNVDTIYEELYKGGKVNAIGNIYSLSAGDNGRTLTARIKYTSTFDIARFATMDSKVAVLTGDATVDENIANALKSTKRCVSVDLSGMTYSSDIDDYLVTVKTGTVMYVKLPTNPYGDSTLDIKKYAGTTFGAIARIRNVKWIEYDEETGTNIFEKIAVLYQRVPGALTDVADYRSPEMSKEKHIRYRGYFDMEDVNNLMTHSENIYCDMSDVKIVKYNDGITDEQKNPVNFTENYVTEINTDPSVDMSVIKNDIVQYLALPVGTSLPADLEAFKSDNCPKLLGIGTFSKDTGALCFHAYPKKTIYNDDGTEEYIADGAADDVVSMISDDGDKFTSETPIKTLKMSGFLTFQDISSGNSNIDADGHYTAEDIQGKGAFTSIVTQPVESCDFTDAIFPVQTDMHFYAGGIIYFNEQQNTVKEIHLPTSPMMTLIPENCMWQLAQIEELCIPANYEVIEKNAFNGMLGLKKITTTDDDPEIITDHGEGSIVLSANIKKIYKGAFWGIDNMYDIYILATTAPECESGAFHESMVWGNNGFTNVHPSKRMNYINEGKIIGMLHYPRVIVGTDEEKNYTDITRKYTLIDETGALNGKGELFVWPTHSEFGRSYHQARCAVKVEGKQRGCTWNAWKEKDDKDFLYTDYSADILLPLTMDNTYDFRYAGWHEFVLANNYYRKASEGEITPDYSKFKEQDWYTICFPYNMTRSQLLKYFGVPAGDTYKDGDIEVTAAEDKYPDVRTLVEVKRHRNHTATEGLITFVFSDNLITKDGGKDVEIVKPEGFTEGENGYYMANGEKPWKYVEAKTATGEFENDPIIVKGGYPYIIKPYLPIGKDKEDVHFIPATGDGELRGGHTIKADNGQDVSVPYINHIVYAIDVDATKLPDKEIYAAETTETGTRPYQYHFIGTYGFTDANPDVASIAESYKELPMYSFFISKTKNNPRHLLYRNMTEGIKWNALTSIIGGKSSAVYKNLSKNPSRNTGDMTNVFIDFQCDNDAFEDQSGNVKKTILAMDFAEDNGGATGITDYTAPQQGNTNPGVYSIDGRYIGTRKDNLPKGIYVTNGKKYIVK